MGAEQACQASDIQTESKLSCSAERACMDASIKVDSVNCLGKMSCANADIEAKIVRAYGAPYSRITAQEIDVVSSVEHGGIRYAVIDSGEYKVVDYKLNGYLIGYKAKITCNAGSTCNVVCGGNGCKGMTMYCLHGSTCNVSPDGCDDLQVADEDGDMISDYIHCPKVVRSESEEDDDNLIAERDLNINLDENEALHEILMFRKENVIEFGASAQQNAILMIRLGIIAIVFVGLMALVYSVRMESDDKSVDDEQRPLLIKV